MSIKPDVLRNGLVLAALYFLTGCNRLMPMIVKGPNQSTPNAAGVTFIGAGQSNMAFENLNETFLNAINVASPGTTIAQWQPGQPLYQAMVNTIRKQRNPCVLLFWQGEAEGLGFDANSTPDNDWPNWSQKFLTMVRTLRQDVGYQIPVVYVQIGQVNTGVYPSPHWGDVQAAQMAVNGALPDLVMISAADLFPQADGLVHYSDTQYQVMQKRMLNAWTFDTSHR